MIRHVDDAAVADSAQVCATTEGLETMSGNVRFVRCFFESAKLARPAQQLQYQVSLLDQICQHTHGGRLTTSIEQRLPSCERASHVLPTCPVRTMQAWIEAAAISGGPLFRSINRHGRVQPGRLSGIDVARVVKKLAVRAGLDAAQAKKPVKLAVEAAKKE